MPELKVLQETGEIIYTEYNTPGRKSKKVVVTNAVVNSFLFHMLFKKTKSLECKVKDKKYRITIEEII